MFGLGFGSLRTELVLGLWSGMTGADVDDGDMQGAIVCGNGKFTEGDICPTFALTTERAPANGVSMAT